MHAANIQDRDGAKELLSRLAGRFPRLRLIWADGGYAGKLVEWTRHVCHWTLEIVRRNDDVTGFRVLPRRWVVERTFAWLGRYRRLSKDYEQLPESSESMILIAMINLMSPIPLRAWLRLRLRQGFGPLRQDRKRRRLVNSSWHRIRGQATVDVLSKALGRRRLPRLPTVTQPPVELMGWAIGPSICVSARLYLPAGSGRPLRPPLHRI